MTSRGTSALQAVAVIETASIARGAVVLDALAKKAPVTIKQARAVSPGKFVIVFGGDVAATEESLEAAKEAAGSNILDELFLPGAHPQLLGSIDQAIAVAPGEALGVVEMSTVAAAIAAADTALKATTVAVMKMHLALGIGGKGVFTVAGDLADVEAALDAVREGAHPDRVVGIELIAQPHPEARGFLL